MPSFHSVAANLPQNCRTHLAIEALAGNAPISRIAVRENVSRKFLYRQKKKAAIALDLAFSPDNEASDVLFYLPVTKAWLIQLVLGLVLTCHSSYRGVIQLLADLFDTPISLGTVHNLLDEIFQGNRPVLTGVDVLSTYCYLLAEAEHRDEDT
jgi:hypothetical protein